MILKNLPFRLAVVSVISLALLTVLYFYLMGSHTSTEPEHKLFAEYSHAAVVTNAEPCSTIAKQILLKGGKAVDAMISALLCEGVTMPHTLGIGGGFFMNIYDKKTGNVTTITARETAPAKSTADMFHGSSELSQRGGLAVGIPGEVKGYWRAYQKFGGGIPWKEIFMPVIAMCEEGIPINKILARMIVKFEDDIQSDEEFRLLFVNQNDGELLEAGSTYKNLKLAKTLRIIAEQGGDAFYKGQLAKNLVTDIQNAGGIITEEDLANYDVRLEKALETKIFDKYTLHTAPPPSSGIILSYILKLVDGILPASNELLNTHRITEALKYAYGARTKLGDPKFVDISETMKSITSEDYIKRIKEGISDTQTWNNPQHYGGDFAEQRTMGTANLAVLAENGDAVVATSTINMEFGSFVISKSTGIILNNQMDDFSSANIVNNYGVKPSPANFIAPGKIPLSSTCPSIILDQSGNVRLLIGGGGGTKITSSVAISTIYNLLMEKNIKESTNHALFHHQLMPMLWRYYPQRVSSDLIEGMKKIGHLVKPMPQNSFVAITAIERRKDKIYPCSDFRRPGEVEGY